MCNLKRSSLPSPGQWFRSEEDGFAYEVSDIEWSVYDRTLSLLFDTLGTDATHLVAIGLAKDYSLVPGSVQQIDPHTLLLDRRLASLRSAPLLKLIQNRWRDCAVGSIEERSAELERASARCRDTAKLLGIGIVRTGRILRMARVCSAAAAALRYLFRHHVAPMQVHPHPALRIAVEYLNY